MRYLLVFVAFIPGAASDTLWIAADSTPASLLRWTAEEGYRVALFDGRMRFGGDLLGMHQNKTNPVDASITGIAAPQSAGDDTLRAVGPEGLYEIKAGQIRTILHFKTPYGWIPTHLLPLRPGLTLLGGHFGGVYLLEQGAGPKATPHLIPLDEPLGPPLRL